MKTIDEFAAELSNAYSTERYKGGWAPSIHAAAPKMLAALKAQEAYFKHEPSPFQTSEHACKWCVDCVDKLDSLRAEAICAAEEKP